MRKKVFGLSTGTVWKFAVVIPSPSPGSTHRESRSLASSGAANSDGVTAWEIRLILGHTGLLCCVTTLPAVVRSLAVTAGAFCVGSGGLVLLYDFPVPHRFMA